MERLPSVFLAHGSPLSALGGDSHAAALQVLGTRISGMKTILVVSAHWQTSAGLRITSWNQAPLVYDFGGFPDELYRIQYPAPGDPLMAAHIAGLLRSAGYEVASETVRGLDHGAWVPLRLAWPQAPVPVIQLSLPDASPQRIFELGRVLQPLRSAGVLLVGSGGVVHNLRRVHFADKDAPVDSWAAEFDQWVADRVEQHDLAALFEYRTLAPHAALAVPSSEHFDPLFFTLGAATEDDRVETVFSGFQYGNLSMRSLLLNR